MLNANLLSGLPPGEADQVLALGSSRLVLSGEELFHLGDPADNIYLISRGRIRLTLPMRVRDREEEILVEEMSPGQTVGWSALIPPYRFTLTAKALLETEVIALPRLALTQHLAAHPGVGYTISLNVAAVVGQRLQLFQAMWLREVQRVVELRCA